MKLILPMPNKKLFLIDGEGAMRNGIPKDDFTEIEMKNKTLDVVVY